MSEKLKYAGEPLGDLEVIPDFLPHLEELIFRPDKTKSQRESKHGRRSS